MAGERADGWMEMLTPTTTTVMKFLGRWGEGRLLPSISRV